MIQRKFLMVLWRLKKEHLTFTRHRRSMPSKSHSLLVTKELIVPNIKVVKGQDVDLGVINGIEYSNA
jgi:hypothetical protein